MFGVWDCAIDEKDVNIYWVLEERYRTREARVQRE